MKSRSVYIVVANKTCASWLSLTVTTAFKIRMLCERYQKSIEKISIDKNIPCSPVVVDSRFVPLTYPLEVLGFFSG